MEDDDLLLRELGDYSPPAQGPTDDEDSILRELEEYSPSGSIDVSDIPSQVGEGNILTGAAQGAPAGFSNSIDTAIGTGARQIKALAGGDLTQLSPVGAAISAFKEVTSEEKSTRPYARIALTEAGVIDKDFDFDSLSPSAKIGFRGAEVAGESLPFMVGGVAAAPTKLAATRFAAIEGGSIAGAAQGSMIAEGLFPGNPVAGFIGEVGGALVSPIRLVTGVLDAAGTGIGRAASALTPAGRKRTAAAAIQAAMIDAGEDPQQVAAALRRADEAGVDLTSAAKVGSKTLSEIEKAAKRSSESFAVEAGERTRISLQALDDAAEALSKTGDPADLARAASLREKKFSTIIGEQIARAKEKAMEAAAGIQNVPGASATASSTTQEIIRSALKTARKAESELWDKIPKGAAVETGGLRSAVQEAQSRLLETESLPVSSEISRAIEKILERSDVANLTGPNVGEMLKLRSRLGSLATQARARQNFDEAATLDILQDGVTKDIAALEIPEVDQARAFSKALHDKFTRSFAGDSLRQATNGAERIAPETLMERAFAGSGVAPAVRFRELEEAAQFADEVTDTSFLNAVRSQEEAFLRNAAGELLENGVVNPTRLQKFLQSNQEVLQNFPKLAAELGDAKTAAIALRDAEKLGKTASRAVRQKAVFSKVVGAEDPTRLVGNMVYGDSPQRSIKQLARLARGTGGNAVGGLKTTIIDAAQSRATSANGVDYNKFADNLFTAQGKGKPPIVETMVREGVISRAEATRLRTILTRAGEIQSNVARQAAAGELVEPTSAITDFIIRFGGARLGTALGGATGGGGGHTLLQASAGSRLLRTVLEKVPATRSNDILIEAARDPDLMADLLTRTDSIPQAREAARSINAALIQAGIIPDEEEE